MDNSTGQKINVKVTIEGISLPLTVSSTEEEKIYREAASMIQSRLSALRDRYPTLPSEKYYYAMAMLNTAVEAVKVANKVDNEPFFEMISDLETEINKVIKK